MNFILAILRLREEDPTDEIRVARIIDKLDTLANQADEIMKLTRQPAKAIAK